MIRHPIGYFSSPEQGSKYDVLTLNREWDNTCVVRLRGYDNLVFWKEIRLDRYKWGKSPRQRVLEAQEKAQRKAERLKRQDEIATFEFNSIGGSRS